MRDSAWTQPEARYSPSRGRLQRGPRRHPRAQERGRHPPLNFSDRKLDPGGAGLATTLDDYMRFARMLLNHGSLDGVRILKPSTVKLMSTDQLDPKITERDWLPGKGNGGFGMDFFVRTGQPKDAAENRGTVGEFWWDGAWSTLFWVDPANDMIVLFFTQKNRGTERSTTISARPSTAPDYLGPKGD